MRFFWFIVFFCLCLLAEEAFCRPLPSPVRIRKEIITVRDTVRGFTSEVIEINYSNPAVEYYIPYTSLEEIKKIELSVFDASGKQSRSNNLLIEDIQLPSSVFYSCLRSKRIEFPAKTSFRIKYQRECSDLLLFSGLLLSSSMPVDTFFYEIRIPTGLNLAFDIPYPGMLSYFRVDTVMRPKGKSYFFTAVPRFHFAGNVVFKPTDNTIRRKACMVRLIVTPVGFAGREKDYFGMKIQSLISASTIIPDAEKSRIDSICGQDPDADSILVRILNFVARKIKYLDVEVGYGSFVPLDIGSILRERQADCKGKSNLLCQVLRSKGFDAYLAMASTVDFRCDMDFPSLASGNHMVCLLKRDDIWFFLDPTDENCKPRRISISIQGRTVFVLGHNEYAFIKVPVEASELNSEEFSFDLKTTGGRLNGRFRYFARGMPSAFIDVASRVQDGKRELLGKEYVRFHVPNSLPENVDLRGRFDSLYLECSIQFGPSVLVKTNAVSYLSAGFLPPPIRFAKEATDGCDIILGSTFNIRVHAVVDIGAASDVVCFESGNFREGPFALEIVCGKDKDNIILDYFFTCESNVLSEKDLPVYSRLEAFCNKAFRQVIRFN